MMEERPLLAVMPCICLFAFLVLHCALCMLPAQMYIGLFVGGAFGAGSLSIVSVLAYGAILVIDHALTPGSLSAFVLYSITGEP